MLTLALACALGAGTPLTEGRRLFDALEYQAAATALEKARHAPGLRADERREVLDLLGRAYVALGHREEAELAFAELLREAPDAALPEDASPKLQDVFSAAKRRVYPPGTVTLVDRPAPTGELLVQLIDPWREAAQLTLGERASPQAAYVERRAAAAPTVRFTLDPSTRELYVSAFGAAGQLLGTLYSAAAPRALAGPATAAPAPAIELLPPQAEAAAQQASPRWPGWVVGATAVALAATGLTLKLLSDADDRASRAAEVGAPGHFAVDAQRLNARARAQAVASGVLFGVAAAAGLAAVVVVVAL
ncbi:MAG: hypothetical protein IPJ65_29700 [Archangiaceae bacterium]|nr:hypothetical protein [Archangiaceae bacterium]